MVEFLTLCDLCGRAGPFTNLVLADAARDPVLSDMGVSGAYSTVLCRHCGWVFKPGVLSEEQVAELYSKSGGAATYEVEHREHSAKRSLAIYRLVSGVLPLSGRMLRVLDLGGGAGQAAQVFAERGHFVHILDQYATNAIHPRMTISKGDLDQLGSEDWFDLILMNHVLEHVWSPRRMLSTASRHLAAGGVLFVEVPFELYTPFIKRRLGDPLHVGYFAVHTLRRYLEQCDLDPLWVRRALGQYNARRVMVLRAVARSCTPNRLQRRPSRLERRSLIPRLVLTPLEMLHPFQLALAAVRTRK